MLGTKILHYEILEQIGAGGMGVVYKARDRHLDRYVAIKVLPNNFIDTETRRKRFVQEAKAASALNHPNIVTIHDVDRQDGVDFIAMELIEGRSLDHIIGEKRMPLDEALSYASQIADAAAAAHSHGILHRDLKPANIMVTPAGQVKVLDFGLAKPIDEPAPGVDEATVVNRHLTEDGAIVGTVAYMSPEQAEGRKLDARSDIFSFGTILYEMITGQRPFQGGSVAGTMAAILREEPKPVILRASSLPPELDRVVMRALRKNPRRRFQTMADLKVVLDELREEFESGRVGQTVQPSASSTRRPWAAFAATAVGGFLIAAVGAWISIRPQPPAPFYNFRQLTYDSGLTTSPALSLDGKFLAYASDRADGTNLDLYVQQVAGGKPIRLTDNPEDDSSPSFSPDGSQIVFRSERDGGGIYLVPTFGGEARLLAKNGQSPRFSPDNKTIAFHIGGLLRASAIYVVSANGGAPKRLDTGIAWASNPVWSYDGRRLLFAGSKTAALVQEWFVTPAVGGNAIVVGLPDQLKTTVPVQQLPDAGILATHASSNNPSPNQWIVRLSPDWQFRSAERITAGPGTFLGGVASDTSGRRVVLTAAQTRQQIWSIGVDANTGKIKSEMKQLTGGAADSFYPTASVDGRSLVYTSKRSGNWEVYGRDLASGRERALTAGSIGIHRAELSPDGARVAFTRGDGSLLKSVSLISLKGGVEDKVCDECTVTILGWSPGGNEIILYGVERPTTPFLFDVGTARRTPLIGHPAWNINRPRFSPDGRWLAFGTRNETLAAIRIAPFRNGQAIDEKDWISITAGEGNDSSPLWSPDGSLLYFVSGRDGFLDFWAQKLDEAKRPVGSPFEVLPFHTARRRYIGSSLGMTITRDTLFWSTQENTGNIFLAEREEPQSK